MSDHHPTLEKNIKQKPEINKIRVQDLMKNYNSPPSSTLKKINNTEAEAKQGSQQL